MLLCAQSIWFKSMVYELSKTLHGVKATVTSKDVAKLAGVSQSTVSRVFVPGSSVSEKTKQKVFDAAKSLNYRPMPLPASDDK